MGECFLQPAVITAGSFGQGTLSIADDLHLSSTTAFLPRSVVLVAPTSTSAKPGSFRPEIDIEGTVACVLVEQVGAVDPQRLGDLAGHLTTEEQWRVDAALLSVLGLD